jgi:hypothetical protein
MVKINVPSLCARRERKDSDILPEFAEKMDPVR